MAYKLQPLSGEVSLIDLKTDEIRGITGRTLINLEQRGNDALQYGRVVSVAEDITKVQPDDIVLYAKLASDRTNIGEHNAWQILVAVEHIHGKIVEIK